MKTLRPGNLPAYTCAYVTIYNNYTPIHAFTSVQILHKKRRKLSCAGIFHSVAIVDSGSHQ